MQILRQTQDEFKQIMRIVVYNKNEKGMKFSIEGIINLFVVIKLISACICEKLRPDSSLCFAIYQLSDI